MIKKILNIENSANELNNKMETTKDKFGEVEDRGTNYLECTQETKNWKAWKETETGA